jgi:KaiC/GvpD/RAD55 family RecA-like ATPase
MKTLVAPLLKSDGSPIRMAGGGDIYWLDELLNGELILPADLGRPLVVLLAGPPGAGKSLLIQQICYNIARRHCESDPIKASDPGESSSLVISTEMPANAIQENLEEMRMEQKTATISGVSCCIFSPAPNGQRPLMRIVGPCPDSDAEPGVNSVANFQEWIDKIRQNHDEALPRIVVVDSLNVLLDTFATGNLFAEMMEVFKVGVSYLFLVVDTPSPGGELSPKHQPWEYIADAIIRLDYKYGKGRYFLRELEIVKTRPQYHCLGKYLMKIFPYRNIQGGNLATDPEGARPNIERGGVFVFPSLHYVLSKIRQGKPLVQVPPSALTLEWALHNCPGEPEAWGPGPIAPPIGTSLQGLVNWTEASASLNWPVPWCFELVGSGVPLHHTTALVGQRGARKSYFGYQFLLDGVANGEQTLVLSFRDNPVGVRATLQQIARAPRYAAIGLTVTDTNPIVIYQRPGYVTPEELLHRIITAVGQYGPTRVLVNAIDHWEAGYPLLAESPILLSTLIDFLNSHKVTSMVVGVEAGGGSLARCGLTAEADVVLSFEYRRIPWLRGNRPVRPSSGPVDDGFPPMVPLLQDPSSIPASVADAARGVVCTRQPKVVVRAERVPRAAAGFGRAVLDYTLAKQPDGLPAGLEMRPLAPEYPEGDTV